MKLKKQDIINLSILLGSYLIMVLFITRFRYAYGSDLDWSAQHFAIPDAFRRQFYESGSLFPSFVLNLGAGENIYDLSYYGLYSPVILLSYLFPFVPMYIYIQIVSILGVMVSIVLFYRWSGRKFGSNSAFVLTVMFEFSTGFSMHSHRHIMFVSYMPFLLLAFGAVDNYFQGKKKFSLVIYTFLCIMCCYFFGVSSIAAIVVYGVYEYLRTTEKVTLKDLWNKGSHFAGRIFTAVLMSGILLLPTLYCMLSGRDEGNTKIDLSTLVPGANIDFFCYDTYGMGLTLIAFIAIFSAIVSKNKKHTRFLGITMLAFAVLPGFTLILNGALYVDAKVLIPFMPVCLLLVGRLIEQFNDKSFRWKPTFALTALFVVIYWLLGKGMTSGIIKQLVMFDIIAIAAASLVYAFLKKKQAVYIGAITAAVVAGFVANMNDTLVKNNEMKDLVTGDINTLAETVKEDDDLVRTANLVARSTTVNYIYNEDYLTSNVYSSLHNKKYNKFYFSGIHNENEYRNPALTTQSQSLLYQIYMGQKYLITNVTATPSVMYEKIRQEGEYSLYKCDKVMPLGYSTSRLLNEKAYMDMEYPYSLSALMCSTIVENGGSDSYEDTLIKEVPAFEIGRHSGITKSADGYSVRLEKTVTFSVDLKQPVPADELLLISFKVDNDMKDKGLPSDDAKVFINGIKNNLTDPGWKYYNNNSTFEYVVSAHNEKDIRTLRMKFMSGNYDISDIKCYTMKIDFSKDIDKFSIDKAKTKGDDIVGSIDVAKDGYFKLSVPYSEGFTAYVDGEKTDVECVDTAFIGFPIKEGHHDIKIKFTAPMKKEGLMMSGAGVVILAILIFFEYRKGKRKKNEEV